MSKHILERPYHLNIESHQKEIESNNTYFSLAFSDFDNFKCSQCGNCCKHPWAITVGKEYYDAWNPRFKEHSSGLFKDAFMLHNPPNDEVYAHFRRKPHSYHCVFLSENNVCTIHKDYGEEALPFVCRSYPRSKPTVPHQMIGSEHIMFSCQSAPRNLLKDSNLYYEKKPVNPGLAVHKTKTEKHLKRFFKPFEAMYFLAVVMESLETGQMSAVQHLKSLGHLLTLFSRSDWQSYSALDLKRIGQEHLNYKRYHVPTHEGSPEKQIEALEWFCTFQAGKGAFHSKAIQFMEGLNPSSFEIRSDEQDLLNAYLLQYIRRNLLHYYFYMTSSDDFNYIQQYFKLSLFVMQIQLFAFVLRGREGKGINFNLLSIATNVIEVELGHQTQFIQNHKFSEMPSQLCLQNTEIALSIDLGVFSLVY